jgi:tRNA(Arg) A34 adenosine deaminase TadA
MNETANRLYNAINLATFAKDPDKQDCVGCLIYSAEGNALGSGWNQTLDDSPMRNSNGKAVPYVAHAETVAVQDALSTLDSERGALLNSRYNLKAYCTKEPCLHCLVQLANAQVAEVHFIDAIPYEKSGREWLKHFPSIRTYQEHPDQLPLLLRALGVRSPSSTEPVPCTPS